MATTASNLKGTYIRRLRDDAGKARTNAMELAKRTTGPGMTTRPKQRVDQAEEGKILRMTKEIQALREQVNALILNCMKGAKQPSQRVAASRERSTEETDGNREQRGKTIGEGQRLTRARDSVRRSAVNPEPEKTITQEAADKTVK